MESYQNISIRRIYLVKYGSKKTNPAFSHAFLVDLQLETSNSAESQLLHIFAGTKENVSESNLFYRLRRKKKNRKNQFVLNIFVFFSPFPHLSQSIKMLYFHTTMTGRNYERTNNTFWMACFGWNGFFVRSINEVEFVLDLLFDFS